VFFAMVNTSRLLVINVRGHKDILLKAGHCFNCLRTKRKSKEWDVIVREPVDTVTADTTNRYVNGYLL